MKRAPEENPNIFSLIATLGGQLLAARLFILEQGNLGFCYQSISIG
jgi:hypothetical protein